MTLNKAFKDVYCKFLTEQGYQWCSKLQRFVKVVNQELIYFIGLKKVPAWLKGNKGFTITAGIMSVYFSKRADWTHGCTEDKLFKWAFDYTGLQLQMFSATYEYGMGFEYNEQNMIEVVEKSAEITKKLVLPVFAEVTDLTSYVKYAKEYTINVLRMCDKFIDDSLVLILTNNHDDFMECLQKEKESEREFIKQCIEESYTTPRDRVYNNPELLKAALEEAKKCKKTNLEMLAKYKINI